MKVTVVHTLRDFEADQKAVARKADKDMRSTVREGLRVGNDVAKTSAKRTAGKHGKYYHRAFSYEMHSAFHGFGSSHYSGEYGPDISKPQGEMSFEYGSRNQKPHLDLAKSADLIGPSFAQEVRGLPGKWFW